MPDPREGALDDLKSLVDRHGWAYRHVLGDPAPDSAPFTYTVGLTDRGWAELIVTGLPVEVAGVYLANAVDEQESRGAFGAGQRSSALTESGEVIFIKVDDTSGMTATHELMGDFEALQLIWPDSTDRFPWQVGYRNGPTTQPILGEFPGS